MANEVSGEGKKERERAEESPLMLSLTKLRGR